MTFSTPTRDFTHCSPELGFDQLRCDNSELLSLITGVIDDAFKVVSIPDELVHTTNKRSASRGLGLTVVLDTPVTALSDSSTTYGTNVRVEYCPFCKEFYNSCDRGRFDSSSGSCTRTSATLCPGIVNCDAEERSQDQ